MFYKLAVLFVSAVAIVSAMPADDPAAIGSTTINKTTNKCNVGKLSCCMLKGSFTFRRISTNGCTGSSVQKPSDKAQQNQLGALNLALGTVHGLLGVHCNPISGLIGAGTSSNW